MVSAQFFFPWVWYVVRSNRTKQPQVVSEMMGLWWEWRVAQKTWAELPALCYAEHLRHDLGWAPWVLVFSCVIMNSPDGFLKYLPFLCFFKMYVFFSLVSLFRTFHSLKPWTVHFPAWLGALGFTGVRNSNGTALWTYSSCHYSIPASKTKLPERPLLLTWPFSFKCLKFEDILCLEICLVAVTPCRWRSSWYSLPPKWPVITESHLLILQWPFPLEARFPCLDADNHKTSWVPAFQGARWRVFVTVTAGRWCAARILPKAQEQSSH